MLSGPQRVSTRVRGASVSSRPGGLTVVPAPELPVTRTLPQDDLVIAVADDDSGQVLKYVHTKAWKYIRSMIKRAQSGKDTAHMAIFFAQPVDPIRDAAHE